MPAPSGGVERLSKNTEPLDQNRCAFFNRNNVELQITKVIPITHLVAPRLLDFESRIWLSNHKVESPWIVVLVGLDRHPEAENYATRQSHEKQHRSYSRGTFCFRHDSSLQQHFPSHSHDHAAERLLPPKASSCLVTDETCPARDHRRRVGLAVQGWSGRSGEAVEAPGRPPRMPRHSVGARMAHPS